MSSAADALKAARAADTEVRDGQLRGVTPPKPGETQPLAPELNPLDPGSEWAVIPRMVGSFVAAAMPECAPAFSEAMCMDWGRSFAAVAEKYNWKLGNVGPEIALLTSTAAMVIPCVIAYKARQEIARQAEQRRRPPNPVELKAVQTPSQPPAPPTAQG